MLIQLNFKSGKPVYLQVVDQVKAAAASGALRAGEPLPSIRPLAEQLRVNRNTVAKAYTELEGQGVIETIAGRGCFLKENHSPFRKDVRLKMVARRLMPPSCRPTICRWRTRNSWTWSRNGWKHSNKPTRPMRPKRRNNYEQRTVRH